MTPAEELKNLRSQLKGLGIIEYQGQLYSSVSAWVEHLGLNPSSVRALLADNMTLEEAVAVATRRKVHEVEYDGQTYASKAECLRELGLNASTVYARTASGEYFIDVVDDLKNRTTGLVFQGFEFPTIASACRLLNITRKHFVENLAHSTPAEALLDAYKQRRRRTKTSTFLVNGEVFFCPWHLCVAHGVCPIEFDNLVELKWDSDYTGSLKEGFEDFLAAMPETRKVAAKKARENGYFLYQVESGQEPAEPFSEVPRDYRQQCIDEGLIYDAIYHDSLFTGRYFDRVMDIHLGFKRRSNG